MIARSLRVQASALSSPTILTRALGRLDRAVTKLRRAHAEGDWELGWAAFDPRWDPLEARSRASERRAEIGTPDADTTNQVKEETEPRLATSVVSSGSFGDSSLQPLLARLPFRDRPRHDANPPPARVVALQQPRMRPSDDCGIGETF